MEVLEDDELFLQLRTAHRMAVAYYKRLFQILRDTTDRLDLKFYIWGPHDYVAPCRSGTNILKRWEWSMAPGINTNYIFNNADDNNAQKPGEWMLDFYVILDSGVIEAGNVEGIQFGRIKNQDPLDLSVSVEDVKSILRVYIFGATKSARLNWYDDIWNHCDYPSLRDTPFKECVDEENKIFACGFEIPLADLVNEDAVDFLVSNIGRYRDELFK